MADGMKRKVLVASASKALGAEIPPFSKGAGGISLNVDLAAEAKSPSIPLWKRGKPLALLLMACALPAGAADMGDPTRPPTGFSEQPRAAEAPQAAPLQVSSVFLMGAKPYAILDDQVVRVGDKLEQGRIRKIDESGVWLKTPTGIRQLKLLPDVNKTPAGHGKKKVEKR